MCVCACNIHIHIYLHRRMEIRNPSTTPGWSHVIYDYGKNEGVGVACTNVIDNNHIVDAAKINQELHPDIPRPRCCLWSGRLFRLEMLKSTMECVALIVNTKVGVHMDSVGMSVVTLFINVCPS